jgi:uncharacterized membrane protein
MPRPIVAYVATAIVFFALDFIWLSTAMKFYREQLGGLLLDQPNLAVAAAFYVVYVVGLVVLAVLPAAENGTWVNALLAGALLGLVAYGTYDFTNLSTLKGWSVAVSLVDLAWGTFLSGVSATAGYFIVRWLSP